MAVAVCATAPSLRQGEIRDRWRNVFELLPMESRMA